MSKIFEFEQNGKMFDAIESLDKYISEFDGETLPLSLAKNRMLVCAGNFDDAKDLSTQLQFVVDQKNDKAAELERLAYEALSYFFQDRLDMEKIILEKARKLIDEAEIDINSLPITQAFFAAAEGFYYEGIGQFDKALTKLKPAEIYYINLNYTYYLSVLYGHIGKIYQMKGMFTEAQEHFQKEQVTALQTGDNHRITRSIVNLAGLLWKTNKLKEALDAYKKGLKLAQSPEKGPFLYFGELLFNTIVLSLEIDDKNPPLAESDQLRKHASISKNSLDQVRIKIVDALILKSKKRVSQSGKAQELIKSALEVTGLNFDLKVIATITLIELLLEELNFYGSEEIFNEIKIQLHDLMSIAKTQKADPLLLNSLILQAKLSIVDGKLNEADVLFESAKEIALGKNLDLEFQQISTEQNIVMKELERAKTLIAENVTLSDRLEAVKFQEYLANALELKELLSS